MNITQDEEEVDVDGFFTEDVALSALLLSNQGVWGRYANF